MFQIWREGLQYEYTNNNIAYFSPIEPDPDRPQKEMQAISMLFFTICID